MITTMITVIIVAIIRAALMGMVVGTEVIVADMAVVTVGDMVVGIAADRLCVI
jgi:hypothetical protein